MHENPNEREIHKLEEEIDREVEKVERLEERLETLTGDHQEHGHQHERREVEVIVDNKPHRIKSGRYVVSTFKELVKVPASKVLEEVVGGELRPLDDNASIEIKGCEVFISHVRTGGSSR